MNTDARQYHYNNMYDNDTGIFHTKKNRIGMINK